MSTNSPSVFRPPFSRNPSRAFSLSFRSVPFLLHLFVDVLSSIFSHLVVLAEPAGRSFSACGRSFTYAAAVFMNDACLSVPWILSLYSSFLLQYPL
ncbi:hypothetical protein BDV98DRAFT_569371 [Pterulicium gracile]|uniref:Uncharacterized protein n=1 Tax=Pterulicium gracile TaxID=1884261 RepID=A0A5C3QG13_9AGAR|nr:hypothetical protein BDV98DRAFT_569371 [Pterula gracilis]